MLLAYKNIGCIGQVVDRPKALGDIRGISYIYGIFNRFELIKMPEKLSRSIMREKYESGLIRNEHEFK